MLTDLQDERSKTQRTLAASLGPLHNALQMVGVPAARKGSGFIYTTRASWHRHKFGCWATQVPLACSKSPLVPAGCELARVVVREGIQAYATDVWLH